MKLSIVSTLYQSAPYVEEFHARVSKVARELVDNEYEIVLVNDGSPDASLDLAIRLKDCDQEHVIIIDLSRNFGHHKAMMTGLMHASGELVFLIDSDLEEDPELLKIFAQQMRLQGCEVVYGVQKNRKGGWFERTSGKYFYRIFNFLTDLNLPENLVTARLMTSQYVSALLRHQERELLISGLWHLTGFKQSPCIIRKHNNSKSTYTLRRRISFFVNAVASFSNKPLVAIFYIGLLIFLVAAAFTLYLIINTIFISNPVDGWTSVIASIWLLGGILISFLGVLGIYLSKVFTETKQRPYTIIRRVYGR